MRTAFFALFIVVSLPSAQAEDSARIYVYSRSETLGSSQYLISCDGEGVAKLDRGVFFALDVTPGRHILDTGEEGVPAFVDLRPSEGVFVRLAWVLERGGPAITFLHAVEPALARKELLQLRYIDANMVLSELVLKEDPRQPPQLKTRGGSAAQ